MLVCSLAAAVAVVLTWTFTPAVAVTLVLFAASGAFVATRTVSGTVYGFSVAGDLGREVGAIRGVTTQLGYLIGALVGGAAIAIGGFALLGVAMGGLFVASTLPYASVFVSRARRAARPGGARAGSRQTRALRLKHGQLLTVRPLRNGDVETVTAVFERLGERSRRTRFNGPKPRLAPAELDHLAAVDATRHVLVGYLQGDSAPSRSRVSSATGRAPRSPSRWSTSTSGSGSARRSPRSCSPTRERRGSRRSRRSSRAKTRPRCRFSADC